MGIAVKPKKFYFYNFVTSPTRQQYKICFTKIGKTAQWFHITQPVDGWVFGAWLATLGGSGEDSD
jgi:hypothetical protein